jgi:hypothetical protein
VRAPRRTPLSRHKPARSAPGPRLAECFTKAQAPPAAPPTPGPEPLARGQGRAPAAGPSEILLRRQKSVRGAGPGPGWARAWGSVGRGPTRRRKPVLTSDGGPPRVRDEVGAVQAAGAALAVLEVASSTGYPNTCWSSLCWSSLC